MSANGDDRPLELMGYFFDHHGELRTRKDARRFVFTTQEQYEDLGEAVTEEVYFLLQSKCGLQKIPLTESENDDPEEYGFFFASPDYDRKKTVLVLIHGTGVVRAGQWARRLIINDNLARGTQIPYIERAIANGWGVVVLNANHNSILNDDAENVILKNSSTSREHCLKAWSLRLLEKTEIENIMVVAHSRGGSDISYVVDNLPDERRISVICLTDAFYSVTRRNGPIAINWNVSGSYILRTDDGYKRYAANGAVIDVYAGTSQHERSSYSAMESVFYVLENAPTLETIGEIVIKACKIIDEGENENAFPMHDEEKDEKNSDSECETSINESPDIDSEGNDNEPNEVGDGEPSNKVARLE